MSWLPALCSFSPFVREGGSGERENGREGARERDSREGERDKEIGIETEKDLVGILEGSAVLC